MNRSQLALMARHSSVGYPALSRGAWRSWFPKLLTRHTGPEPGSADSGGQHIKWVLETFPEQ